ncbi:MAG TPA: hypothetical protein VNV16_02325 [Methylibium sp.]|nr:hypothetical protein [Methylibium sp.]
MTTQTLRVRAAVDGRASYLAVLTWLFALFNSVRLLSYLPTLWMIHSSGDSSQHSLWTWGTWLGANLTMAAWLYEQNGQRMGRAVAVSLGNASMCAATVALIAAQRFGAF